MLTLHPVTPNDAPDVAEAVAALLGELDPQGQRTAQTLLPVARATLALPGVSGLLARDAAGAAAIMLLYDCAAIYAGGRFGEITELWGRRDLRGQGLASRMLAQARKIGAARGWQRIEVGAPDRDSWPRTLAFYKREGFDEVGPRLRCLV